jgi:ribonucleoside-diphosphate reductase alpha chain
VTAVQHLEIWKKFALHWCEHKPSVTIYVGEEEWLEVGAWCYKNFDILSGVSFLPRADESHSYEVAPYEEITKETYKTIPKIGTLGGAEERTGMMQQTKNLWCIINYPTW